MVPPRSSKPERLRFVALHCGHPLYYKAFWEMYVGPDSPGGEPFTVNPGDLIEASVTFVPYVGPGAYVLSVKDVTTGSGFSTAQECNPSVFDRAPVRMKQLVRSIICRRSARLRLGDDV
jgi:hypothetical protein